MWRRKAVLLAAFVRWVSECGNGYCMIDNRDTVLVSLGVLPRALGAWPMRSYVNFPPKLSLILCTLFTLLLSTTTFIRSALIYAISRHRILAWAYFTPRQARNARRNKRTCSILISGLAFYYRDLRSALSSFVPMIYHGIHMLPFIIVQICSSRYCHGCLIPNQFSAVCVPWALGMNSVDLIMSIPVESLIKQVNRSSF